MFQRGEELFTGLIEEKGIVESVEASKNDADNTVDLAVQAKTVSEDVKIGDSIAINGCCLTVVKISGESMTFQAGRETLSRTNLGDLKAGSAVNLERALRVGDRMGGHYVSGHVDALGTVDQRLEHQVNGEVWCDFWFSVPSELTRQMASKGSVTVDGISLTLVDVETERFSVAIIPHTLAETTLGSRQVGDAVNIETDLLAKYVQQQMDRS